MAPPEVGSQKYIVGKHIFAINVARFVYCSYYFLSFLVEKERKAGHINKFTIYSYSFFHYTFENHRWQGFELKSWKEKSPKSED